MADSEHAEHHVSHERFDELKAEYCRRCGLPLSQGEHKHEHEHHAQADDEPVHRHGDDAHRTKPH
ncbi:hypothetical protein [Agromyces allii]|uniref:hypothetical protein n=1 Tax=Agromyces allii TaxID=393607 RepID=UPI0012FBB644|nr:hypothetical protein [Agromyces allii]